MTMVHHLNFDDFVTIHKPQLLSSDIPRHYWEALYKKLIEQIFDAGDVFSLLKIDYENEEKEKYDPIWSLQMKLNEGLSIADKNAIFLVDHAWTFRTDFAKKQLMDNEKLLQRMAFLTDINLSCDLPKEKVVENIQNELWKYCCTYSVGNAETAEEKVPVWYVMDEVGSSIQHSDNPNFKIVPFIYVPEQITYTLLFPIKDVTFTEHITRDYAEGIADEDDRKALLLPWIYSSFSDIDFKQVEPNEEYFLSGHIQENLPDLSKFTAAAANDNTKKRPKLKVYTEYDLVKIFLTSDRFEIVENEEEADILWLTRHFKTYKELSETPCKFVNQFPYEHVLTVKDLLSVVGRRKANNKWLPITYNLKTELSKFVAYYQHREKLQLDNHWICKPWNLARSLDTHITARLEHILRLPETGPKIAQKYISRPVLFYRPECAGRVKFDVRYVVLLKSVKPLQLYACKNFYLRFANRPFDLTDLDVYEKHFTVMNYTANAALKHVTCAEFLNVWPKQYANVAWSSVEAKVFKMLRELFEAAVSKQAPCGICDSPQSRALYAADVMLEWDDACAEIEPKLLEVNWTPDCKRACDYYADFYNDIFALLFLDEANSDAFQEL